MGLYFSPSVNVDGSVFVTGPVATNGAAGNFPVYTAGIYEATPSTYNNNAVVPFHMDVNGNLKVSSAATGALSPTNSSTTPLGGGGVFTGTSVNVLAYGSIVVTVFANVASATNGLSIQQSMDNVNWDVTDTYTIAASTAKTFSIPRQANFMRVAYTNGAGAQATFRLQTILNQQQPAASSVKTADGLSAESDAELTYAAAGLFDGTSTINLWRGTATGGGFVQGNIATGAAESGNPLLSGARARATLISVTDATRQPLIVDAVGQLYTTSRGAGISDGDGQNNAYNRVVDSGGNPYAVQARNYVFDPSVAAASAWNRQRGDVNGLWTSGAGLYETVAASQSNQILGATGAVGDYLARLIIVPATTTPGAVSIVDGNGASITVFAGGTVDVKPIPVEIGMKTVNATTPGWKVTTGTNVSVIGVGRFT